MKTLDVFHLLPLGLRDVFLLLPLGEGWDEGLRPFPLTVLPHLLSGEGWGDEGQSSPVPPPLAPLAPNGELEWQRKQQAPLTPWSL